MEPMEFVRDSVMAIATAWAQKGVEVTVDKAKSLIESICQEDPALHGKVDIDELAEQIHATAGQVGHVAYNEETLARYLEIPLPDLAVTSPENLDISVLYYHVKLEREFRDWFVELGYEVDLGRALTGLRGVEYVPDVYGRLDTLHGQFEICLSFVSDVPPDEDRVFALLGKIEAYAEAKKSFSHGDIFSIVTPHPDEFTSGAMNAMALQNEQENYSVVPLDGGDVAVLEKAATPRHRLEELQDKVRQADEQSRAAKIRRSAQDIEQYR